MGDWILPTPKFSMREVSFRKVSCDVITTTHKFIHNLEVMEGMDKWRYVLLHVSKLRHAARSSLVVLSMV